MNMPRFSRFFRIASSLIIASSAAVCLQADPNAALFNAVQPFKGSADTIVPSAPSINARAYVLIDANSGRILAQKNMHKRIPPASLTKLMTLYVVSEALQAGHIKLDDKVHISEKAWRMGGSKMFVRDNSYVPVQELIHGIIVSSGNDACVALAEYVGGNETTFAQMMDQAAAKLGMKDTHYVDSTGLPKPNHYSSAYDMSLLARALIHQFPEYYPWYKQKWFTYNNIRQPNRNRLLWRDPSVDGLKTGHTRAAGYCLITSAMRQGMRLIAVVTGTPTDEARANDSQALLNYGFRYYNTEKRYDAGTPIIKQRIYHGTQAYINLGVNQPVYMTFLRGSEDALKTEIRVPRLYAPIQKNQPCGQLILKEHDQTVATVPLIALTSDPKGGLWRRWSDTVSLWFTKKEPNPKAHA